MIRKVPVEWGLLGLSFHLVIMIIIHHRLWSGLLRETLTFVTSHRSVHLSTYQFLLGCCLFPASWSKRGNRRNNESQLLHGIFKCYFSALH